jgi:hypothetical protein
MSVIEPGWFKEMHEFKFQSWTRVVPRNIFGDEIGQENGEPLDDNHSDELGNTEEEELDQSIDGNACTLLNTNEGVIDTAASDEIRRVPATQLQVPKRTPDSPVVKNFKRKCGKESLGYITANKQQSPAYQKLDQQSRCRQSTHLRNLHRQCHFESGGGGTNDICESFERTRGSQRSPPIY